MKAAGKVMKKKSREQNRTWQACEGLGLSRLKGEDGEWPHEGWAHQEQIGQGCIQEEVSGIGEEVCDKRLGCMGQCSEAGAQGIGHDWLRGYRRPVCTGKGPLREGQGQ